MKEIPHTPSLAINIKNSLSYMTSFEVPLTQVSFFLSHHQFALLCDDNSPVWCSLFIYLLFIFLRFALSFIFHNFQFFMFSIHNYFTFVCASYFFLQEIVTDFFLCCNRKEWTQYSRQNYYVSHLLMNWEFQEIFLFLLNFFFFSLLSWFLYLYIFVIFLSSYSSLFLFTSKETFLHTFFPPNMSILFFLFSFTLFSEFLVMLFDSF